MQADSGLLEVFEQYDSTLARTQAELADVHAANAALVSALTEAELQAMSATRALSDPKSPARIQALLRSPRSGGSKWTLRSSLGINAGDTSDDGGDDDGVAARRLERPLSAPGVRRSAAAEGNRSSRAKGLFPTKQKKRDSDCCQNQSTSDRATGEFVRPMMTGSQSSNISSKTLGALRSNSKRLETQVQELSQELADARREKLSLLRYKRQYEAAAGALKEQRKAAEQAAAAAEAAGLRAAAATGKADRLQMQVSKAVMQKAHESRCCCHRALTVSMFIGVCMWLGSELGSTHT